MVIAELLASLGVQVDEKSLKKVDSVLGGVASNASKILGGVAAIFGGAQLTSFVKELVAVGSELNDTAVRLGTNTRALQEYRFAAQQVGVDNATLDTSFRFLAKSSYDASTGGKEAAAVYRKLGVNVKDANGNLAPAEDLFIGVAQALSELDNESEKTALALKVFGRGGQAILPLVNEGAEGIARLRAEFGELGGGFSDEFVAQADALGDSMDALETAGQSLKSTFGVAVFPIIQWGVNLLLKLEKGFHHIIDGTRLVKSGLAVMTAAFVAWGVAALWAARQAIAGWLAAVAPFVLVGVALAALALILDDVAALLTGGKSLVGKYLDEWFGVGTADALVRNWAEGVRMLGEAFDWLADVGGEALMWIDQNLGLVNIAVLALTGPFGLLAKLAVENLDLIGNKIKQFADWVLGIGETIANALDPTGGLSSAVKEHFGALRKLLPDMPDISIPGLGGLPGDAVNRVNRDGSAFFDFAAHPGVAAPDAVHPALRPGSVATDGGHGGPVTVDARVDAPITVHGATDPRATARAIREELDARESSQASRLRHALTNRPKGK